METLILPPTTANILRACELIKMGEVVSFPTETVYGIGADYRNRKACMAIYSVKGRPANKPLTIHVADMEQVERVAKISSLAEKLFNAFCPGPLTIIMKKRDTVPDFVTCGNETVGIRFPNNKIARELIKNSGNPLVASSANLSDRVPPKTANEVHNNLNGRIKIILDGGECKLGISSTVIDVSTGALKILRSGTITLDDIKAVL